MLIVSEKVKSLDNELLKKKFISEFGKIYLDIKKMRMKFELLSSRGQNDFYQEKLLFENAIFLRLEELEKKYDDLVKENDKINKIR